MIEDKSSFLLGYIVGNQLKIEYEPIWHQQTDHTLEIYQVHHSIQTTPSVEVH